MTRPCESAGTCAAPTRWPYRDHRSLAMVDLDQSYNCTCELVGEDGLCDACPILTAMEGETA